MNNHEPIKLPTGTPMAHQAYQYLTPTPIKEYYGHFVVRFRGEKEQYFFAQTFYSNSRNPTFIKNTARIMFLKTHPDTEMVRCTCYKYEATGHAKGDRNLEEIHNIGAMYTLKLIDD